MLHFSKLEKLVLYFHLYDGRKSQPRSCLGILSHSPGVHARLSWYLRYHSLQSPYQILHLPWLISFQGTGQAVWSGRPEMPIMVVPSSTAHRPTETLGASEFLMRLKKTSHLQIGSLCGFSSKALTSMLSSAEHSLEKFLYWVLSQGKKGAGNTTYSFLNNLTLLHQSSEVRESFIFLLPKSTPALTPIR